MARLTGRCTVSRQGVVVETLHKDGLFTVFSWQYIRVDTVDSAPEDSHCLFAWTMLFINIYTVNLILSEVVEFCPVTHS